MRFDIGVAPEAERSASELARSDPAHSARFSSWSTRSRSQSRSDSCSRSQSHAGSENDYAVESASTGADPAAHQLQHSAGGLIVKKQTATLRFLRRLGSDVAAPEGDGVVTGLSSLRRRATSKWATVHAPPPTFETEVFQLVAYGNKWWVDVIGFFTNALRAETEALFFILFCLREREDELEVGDVASFYVWLEPYAQFVSSVVGVLQKVYVPWVEGGGDLPAGRERQVFEGASARIMRTLRKTMSHRETFLQYEPVRAARKLREVFSEYAVRLLDYCVALEETTAPMVLRQFGTEDCLHVSRAMVEGLRGIGYKKNVVRLMRWIEGRPETAAAWRRAHMDFMSIIAYGRWRRAGPAEECMAYFKRKSKASENEAARNTR